VPARVSPAARVLVQHASVEAIRPNRTKSGRQRKGHSLSRLDHRDGLPEEPKALQGHGILPGGEAGIG
jgi:hypothetical protein